ncbi:MAG TPA: MFS transporter [Methanotrichaceae archaeon]|nr:MAG: putative transporter [Methanosaeta sp. PtaU1.Bin028]HOT07267.1 MFS transporter [Methanotrichaceae archaeon]HQF17295.1 MFS transporter [Methanotrichaceae archaeon]HQI91868.1 MFS transporter [Methanotrichaceae archaeon]HQJ29198.1 MFS transporter [Methanotrichaceae archaeon]
MAGSLPGNGTRILGVLIAGVFMAALDAAIVGPALPAIRADFQVADRDVVWIYNVYILMYMIGTPLMAKLDSILGRRTVYIGDVLLFAAGSLIIAASPSFLGLLAGRAVQGLGAGGIFPVAIATVADSFPPERRGKALGMLGSVFGIAFIMGPVLGGFLLTFSWKLLFLINIPAGAAVIYYSQKLLPPQRGQRKPMDWAGLVVLSSMVVCLAISVNRLDTRNLAGSLLSPPVSILVIASMMLLPIFWLMERRANDPIIRTSMFETRQMGLAGALSLGAGLVQSGTIFVPTLAVIGLGLDQRSASLMTVPMVATMVAGSNLVGALLDRQGSRRVMMSGWLVLAMGMALISIHADSFWPFMISTTVCGIGFSGAMGPSISYVVLGSAPPAERASAQGAISLVASVGMMVGGALFGAIVASRGEGLAGYEAAYLSMSGIALLMVALTAGLKGRAEEKSTIQ